MRTRISVKRILSAAGMATLFLGLILLWRSQAALTKASDGASPEKPAPSEFKQVQIDLSKAIEVALPNIGEDLKPAQFTTTDGKSGWAVRIPGNKPIATPAYWDGMVFIGGGYGSHEFYAINAQTGAVVWQIKTSDDGPTAAVVEDGCVAFNTESCTVEVCDAKTGKVLWQEWLGDPLMSQPAIYKGRLYIAHPAGQRTGQSNNPQTANPGHQNVAQVAPSGRATGHYLLCADLRTGKHIWDQPIPADVISAPVINDDRVYFTCFDGTSFCFDAASGSLVWKKENSGTSAPLVADGQLVMTQKVQEGGKSYEGLMRVDPKQGNAKDEKLLAKSEADYLRENKGVSLGLSEQVSVSLDSSVGFSSAPSTAKIEAANKQVGVNTVVGGWAYQGSRAAHNKGQMMNAQGRFLNCMRTIDGKFAWRAEVKGAGITADSQVFSPPAVGGLNIYLCSAQGHVLSVRQQDGRVGFLYLLKQPVTFQPALARGNIYVGTANGLLICLRTGDRDADGWYAWGGNAQHNK
jgi:Ca-activated chloride channel family protein